MNKKVKEKDFSSSLIFGPKGHKDLRRLHPQLLEEPEFKSLSTTDMLFVWYFANKTSPFASESSDRVKARFSYEASYGDREPDRKEKYINGIFPEKVREAIEKMALFKPEERVRALAMMYTMFNNLEKLVDVDVDENFIVIDDNGKRVGIDWTARKNYIDSVSKVNEVLPELVRKMEEGFGVAYKGDETFGNSATKAINRYHNSHKETQ
jgi:hypothetical protein